MALDDTLLKWIAAWGQVGALVFAVLAAVAGAASGYAGMQLAERADQKLAQTNLETERLRAKNIELTGQLLPRALSPEQIRAIRQQYNRAVAAGRAGAVYIEQATNTSEGIRFSSQIAEAFVRKRQGPTIGPGLGAPRSGVFVILHDRTRRSVLNILNRNGVQAREMSDYSVNAPDRPGKCGADRIVVGNRPELDPSGD